MYAEVALNEKTDAATDEDIELPEPSASGKTNFYQLEVAI